jgi:cell division protein FtsB
MLTLIKRYYAHFLLLTVLTGGLFLVFNKDGVIARQRLTREKKRLITQNERLQEAVAASRTALERLDSQTVLEARRLGYYRSNETVYQFVSNEPAVTETSRQADTTPFRHGSMPLFPAGLPLWMLAAAMAAAIAGAVWLLWPDRGTATEK